jgi:hypothetical protein
MNALKSCVFIYLLKVGEHACFLSLKHMFLQCMSKRAVEAPLIERTKSRSIEMPSE